MKDHIERKKTIVFVDPPGWQGAVNGNVAFPNAGIAYLGTVLKKAGWEVLVSDMNNSQSAIDGFSGLLERVRPDVVGFSCKTSTFPSAKELALQIREKHGYSIKLIFGGPHVTLNYEELSASNEDFADLLFIGEGEVDIAAVCENLLSDTNAAVLQNGVVRDIEGMKVYLPGSKINIEDLAFPDYSIFDENVREHIREHYPLFTSRGCPYGCIYCTVPLINGRKWRSRPVSNIIDELLQAQKMYGVTGFQIVDDSWNVDMDRCKEMCREMIQRGLTLTWYCPNGIRADRVDKELADLMFRSGCRSVAVGLESGCRRVFEGIKKGTTLEKIEAGIKILQEAGLKVSAFFIIGLPGDSPDGVMDSVDLIKRLKIDALLNILVPYRHTEVHRQIAEKGRFLQPLDGNLHFSNDLKKLNPSFEWNDFSARQMKKSYIVAHLKIKSYFAVIKRRDRWRYLELILVFLKYYPTGLFAVLKEKFFRQKS